MSAAYTKPGHSPLQRRRRRSDHLSPTSPSFPRRLLDRSIKPNDGQGLAGGGHGLEEFETPSPNVKLSSPATEPFGPFLPALPSTTSTSSTADHGAPRPLSDEDSELSYRPSEEEVRPATSDAVDLAGTIRRNGAGSRPPAAVAASSSSTPADTRERISLDPHKRFGDHASSPTLRHDSFGAAQDEPGSGKSVGGKKSRLNLLNPMSLLARRRSSQYSKLEDINLTINTMSVPALPDNFDPSIRGKVVHDFSAPRARRIYSHNDIGKLESPAVRSAGAPDPSRLGEWTGGAAPPSSGSSQPPISHSPMFKEHFLDDRPALQPERTGYLRNVHAFNSTPDAHDLAYRPAFAKRLPSAAPQPETDLPAARDNGKHRPLSSTESLSPPPPTPPPKNTPSPRFELLLPAVLPKHMASTSSRFSFQINESDSSEQEKALEERHKQHAATKKTEAGAPDDEDGEEYGDYDFDLDDGLEEQIPGVNADYDDGDDDNGGFGGDSVPEANALVARYAPMHDQPESTAERSPDSGRASLQGFHFTPQSMTFSPTSTANASQPTPRDHDGFAIGVADSKESAQGQPGMDHALGDMDARHAPSLDGLGITSVHVRSTRPRTGSRPQGQVFDDEDLYFDDGEFGPVDMGDLTGSFDEQLFDDETDVLRDIPAANARRFEAAKNAARPLAAAEPVARPSTTQGDRGSRDEDGRDGPRAEPASQTERPSLDPADAGPGEAIAGLTETNLAAYHDALAFAANQAAANGKFDRKVSFSQGSDETSLSRLDGSQIGVASDESRVSRNLGSALADDDGFPFDDRVDDDAMIAEANAEALENDDEGFYGQEFGFYARSYGKTTSELVNGGYFAQRGGNGIKRSHSGKANFQEPSLTPITERSEWSTRNSVVSLQIPGGLPASAQSLPSPGIAQLLELDSPGFDDDISFSALLKLRGRTFGGSSSSVNSLGGGHPSSPLAHLSAHSFSHSDMGSGWLSSSMHRRSSEAGIPESEEEDEEGERPTLTQNTPRKKTASSASRTSQDRKTSSSPGPVGDRRKGHHSRTSSGAESVSYARDLEGRWVLERRWTCEDGGPEVVDREYLPGARI